MAPSLFNSGHKLPVTGRIPLPPNSALYNIISINHLVSVHPVHLAMRIHRTTNVVCEVTYNVGFLDAVHVDPSKLSQPSLDSQDHWFGKYGSNVLSSSGSRLDDLKGERPVPLVEIEKDVYQINRTIAYELINDLEGVKRRWD